MKILISVAVLALCAGGVALVSVLPARVKELPPKEIAPVNVEVVRVAPKARLPHMFRLPGQIEALRVVDVAAEVAGRIAKIDCREGRPCRKDDKLLWLNTDLLSAQLRQAKATAEFDQRELARLETLLKRDVATPTEVDTARAKAEASKAALDLVQANLDRAEIFAPADGMLNRVPVEEGEYVTPGTVVAQIVQNHQVKIVIDVPERYVKYVRLGDPQRVVMDLDGDREFPGTVSYISELADEKTRTTRVELTVDNLGPGADLSVPDRSPGATVLVEACWPGKGSEGVAPHDIETHLTVRIEAELTGVKGMKEIRSSSSEGLSLTSARFEPGVSPERAVARVRDAVRQLVPRLPAGAQRPRVRLFELAEYWKLARRGLHAGRLVRVDLKLREFRDAIVIPLKAVIPLESGHVVWVVEDGHAQPRKVKLGYMSGWDVVLDRTESELDADDLLIVKGHHFVGPGQAVRIVKGPTTRPAATQPTATQPAPQPTTAPANP